MPTKSNIYPYFRFDDFTNTPVQKNWKVIEMENDYLLLRILPEVGGKIWTAIEKKTGKPFIYDNQVIKFRDVAMRGPWTSGGIEANYGIIGHTPNCATPVDYKVKENPDGSVSCFIGTLDLLTQTFWSMEIKLPADKAWFSTRSSWSNTNPVEQPYYTWMNAGIKAAGNLEFIYPGNAYIGHEGEFATWPYHQDNKKHVAWYEQNNFGSYKSYHVFGKYTDFFGAYWHQDNLGMGRFSWHDEKPGKKIWIWGLSRQGMIWDKLLTDNDGQYVEVQSGRFFNQAADGSSLTPFKHFGFAPYQHDGWTEYWYPVTGTEGMVQSNYHGTLNLKIKDKETSITFQALENLNETIDVVENGTILYSKSVSLKPMQVFTDKFPGVLKNAEVRIGNKLNFKQLDQDDLSRPKKSPEDFDWKSAYGLYLAGKEALRSRYYDKAEEKFRACLEKEKNFLPALSEMAALMFRNGNFQEARNYALKGLSIDTYDPDANYNYGLANAALGLNTDAKDGFDIAALSSSHRKAAYTELARLYLKEKNFSRSIHFAEQASQNNEEALQLLAIAHRLSGNHQATKKILEEIDQLSPLSHFQEAENWIQSGTEQAKNSLQSSTRNELSTETYLHWANWYVGLNRFEDASRLLEAAPEQTEILFWRAWLESKSGKDHSTLLSKAEQSTTDGVFPFRESSKQVFEWASRQTKSWKPTYYLSLIYRGQKNMEKARELLRACGENTGFAPIHALRAEMLPGTEEKDLKRATELRPDQWTYGKRLFDYYISKNDFNNALITAQSLQRRFKDNTAVTLMAAKALLFTNQYTKCSELLNKTTLLPYEGSTEARMVYWSSYILSGLDQLNSKKYPATLTAIEKSLLWPENLGVGKPYEEDLDLRVEHLIKAVALLRMGKKTEGNQWMNKVTGNTNLKGTFGPIALAVAQRINGDEKSFNKTIEDWSANNPSVALAQWVSDYRSGKASAMMISLDQQRIAEGLLNLK